MYTPDQIATIKSNGIILGFKNEINTKIRKLASINWTKSGEFDDSILVLTAELVHAAKDIEQLYVELKEAGYEPNAPGNN